MRQPSPDAAGADAPALRLRGVSRRFGSTWALRGVDLDVDPGELVAMTGPNGAGKTTLLQIAAGLLAPTTGEVTVLGRRHADDADATRRRIGYLPARGYLYDELTGRENLRFACRMSGRRAWEEPADAALARVGLGDAGGLRVREYSSGMRKRLAVARLLLRPAALALMDEPYASLDRPGVDLVDDLVEEMLGRGAAVVMASHRWGRSFDDADRVVELRRGELVRAGAPGGLQGRPHGAGPGGSGDGPGRGPGE